MRYVFMLACLAAMLAAVPVTAQEGGSPAVAAVQVDVQAAALPVPPAQAGLGVALAPQPAPVLSPVVAAVPPDAPETPVKPITWGALIAGIAAVLAALLSRLLSRITVPWLAQLMSGLVVGCAGVGSSLAIIGITDFKAALFAAWAVLLSTLGGVMLPHAQITMTAQPGVALPANPGGLPPRATMGAPRDAGCFRPGFVGLLMVLALIVIGALGCARLTDQVKADSVSAVALWGQYVQGDAHLTPAQKADRATLGTQQTYIGTSGWASKAYVDVAQTITCQLDRYVQGDAALGADVRAGLVRMDRGIREALKLPADCPAPGVTP
jgi:hypothetical protein